MGDSSKISGFKPYKRSEKPLICEKYATMNRLVISSTNLLEKFHQKIEMHKFHEASNMNQHQTSLNGSMILSKGMSLFGNRYEFLELLTNSSFAQIIKVKDIATNTECVIKLFNAKFTQIGAQESAFVNYLQFQNDNDSIPMCRVQDSLIIPSLFQNFGENSKNNVNNNILNSRSSSTNNPIELPRYRSQTNIEDTICHHFAIVFELLGRSLLNFDLMSVNGQIKSNSSSNRNNNHHDDIIHSHDGIDLSKAADKESDILDIHKSNCEMVCRKRRLQHIVQDIVCVLVFLHRNKVIHGDLKTENILLVKNLSQVSSNDNNSNHPSRVKVIDFGNALCFDDISAYYDNYQVQSLHYRAPEVVVGLPFNEAIDAWSLGCIVTELWLGEPLFQGANAFEYLASVTDILGLLPHEIYQSNNCKYYHDYQSVISSETTNECVSGSSKVSKLYLRLNTSDLDFFHFVESLLSLNPASRLTPLQALYHPFLQKVSPVNSLLKQTATTNSSSIDNDTVVTTSIDSYNNNSCYDSFTGKNKIISVAKDFICLLNSQVSELQTFKFVQDDNKTSTTVSSGRKSDPTLSKTFTPNIGSVLDQYKECVKVNNKILLESTNIHPKVESNQNSSNSCVTIAVSTDDNTYAVKDVLFGADPSWINFQSKKCNLEAAYTMLDQMLDNLKKSIEVNQIHESILIKECSRRKELYDRIHCQIKNITFDSITSDIESFIDSIYNNQVRSTTSNHNNNNSNNDNNNNNNSNVISNNEIDYRFINASHYRNDWLSQVFDCKFKPVLFVLYNECQGIIKKISNNIAISDIIKKSSPTSNDNSSQNFDVMIGKFVLKLSKLKLLQNGFRSVIQLYSKLPAESLIDGKEYSDWLLNSIDQAIQIILVSINSKTLKESLTGIRLMVEGQRRKQIFNFLQEKFKNILTSCLSNNNHNDNDFINHMTITNGNKCEVNANELIDVSVAAPCHVLEIEVDVTEEDEILQSFDDLNTNHLSSFLSVVMESQQIIHDKLNTSKFSFAEFNESVVESAAFIKKIIQEKHLIILKRNKVIKERRKKIDDLNKRLNSALSRSFTASSSLPTPYTITSESKRMKGGIGVRQSYDNNSNNNNNNNNNIVALLSKSQEAIGKTRIYLETKTRSLFHGSYHNSCRILDQLVAAQTQKPPVFENQITINDSNNRQTSRSDNNNDNNNYKKNKKKHTAVRNNKIHASVSKKTGRTATLTSTATTVDAAFNIMDIMSVSTSATKPSRSKNNSSNNSNNSTSTATTPVATNTKKRSINDIQSINTPLEQRQRKRLSISSSNRGSDAASVSTATPSSSKHSSSSINSSSINSSSSKAKSKSNHLKSTPLTNATVSGGLESLSSAFFSNLQKVPSAKNKMMSINTTTTSTRSTNCNGNVTNKTKAKRRRMTEKKNSNKSKFNSKTATTTPSFKKSSDFMKENSLNNRNTKVDSLINLSSSTSCAKSIKRVGKDRLTNMMKQAKTNEYMRGTDSSDVDSYSLSSETGDDLSHLDDDSESE